LMSYAADDPEARLRVAALNEKLNALGWVEGRNLKIEYNWAPGGGTDSLRSHARELATTKPELIISNSTPVLTALREEHLAIPIVFVQVTDPVGAGFVESLAKPGGTITGFTDFEYAVGGKWLELLKEVNPLLARAGVIVMPGHPGNAEIYRVMQPAAQASGVSLMKIESREAVEIERAIVALSTGPQSGLIVLPGPLAIAYRTRIIALATQYRLPAIYPFRYFASSGGLISYGIDQVDQWRGAASYADRILRGEKAGDLPVQQPTKFELAINLKTAKALNINIPGSLLLRADEVIE
jgi:putative ABC transport system substrate-binding protein